MTKDEFMRKWAVHGMPADKRRLANAAWDAAIKYERESCAKVCESDESSRDSGGYFAGVIRMRSNATDKGSA